MLVAKIFLRLLYPSVWLSNSRSLYMKYDVKVSCDVFNSITYMSDHHLGFSGNFHIFLYFFLAMLLIEAINHIFTELIRKKQISFQH